MPKKHIKPTPEELDENIKKSVEELDNLKEKEPEEEIKPLKIIIPQEEEKEPIKVKEPEPEPEPVKEEEEEKPQEPDYKKKFVESSREAQVLHAKNKKVNEALEQAMQAPEPTDEELKKEYPDWEMMSEFEKKMAKDSVTNTRRFNSLGEITRENKSLEAWQTKVDTFIDDPKTLVDNTSLEGRQDEFRLFATKPTRRNVDFEDLVKAFLYDVELKKPTQKKGKMFETGTGGPNDKGKPKSDKISIDEARQLRNTDYAKYKEYLKSGKIDIESI